MRAAPKDPAVHGHRQSRAIVDWHGGQPAHTVASQTPTGYHALLAVVIRGAGGSLEQLFLQVVRTTPFPRLWKRWEQTAHIWFGGLAPPSLLSKVGAKQVYGWWFAERSVLLAAAVYTLQRAYATAFLFSLSQRLEAKLCEPIAAFQWYQLDESTIHMKESTRAATQSQHTSALGFGDIETLAPSEPAASQLGSSGAA